jgi:hypothetical protein
LEDKQKERRIKGEEKKKEGVRSVPPPTFISVMHGYCAITQHHK